MVPVQLQLHHRICPRCRSIKREFDALAKEPQPLTGYYWAAASHAVTQRQQQQPAPSQPKPPIQPAPPSQPVLGHLEFSLGKATARKPTDACPCPALEPGYLPDGSLFAVPSVLKEVARNAAMQIRDDGPPEVPLSVFVAGRCRQCNSEAALRCGRCKEAYFCSEACANEAWQHGGICTDGAKTTAHDGTLIPLQWPSHSTTCRPFVQWACSACATTDREVRQCDGPGPMGNGCLEHFCAAPCKLRSACPHMNEIDMWGIQDVRAAAGLCDCLCCEERAASWPCGKCDPEGTCPWWKEGPYTGRCPARSEHIRNLLLEKMGQEVPACIDCDWLTRDSLSD